METRHQQEIARLRTLVEVRDEELRTLRSSAPDITMLVLAFRLSPIQSRMLSLLLSRQTVSRAAMAIWLYGLRPDPVNDKIVDMHLVRLRRKLPDGAAIETIRDYGWRLSPAARAIMQQQIDRQR